MAAPPHSPWLTIRGPPAVRAAIPRAARRQAGRAGSPSSTRLQHGDGLSHLAFFIQRPGPLHSHVAGAQPGERLHVGGGGRFGIGPFRQRRGDHAARHEHNGHDDRTGHRGRQPAGRGVLLGQRAASGPRRRAAGDVRRDGHAVQALEQERSRVAPAPLGDGLGEQPASRRDVARVECGAPGIDEFLRFALTLGQRAARALDVRTSLAVAPLEERHARPHVDRLLVLSREIVIEPRQQELLDTRGALAFVDVGRRSLRRVGRSLRL